MLPSKTAYGIVDFGELQQCYCIWSGWFCVCSGSVLRCADDEWLEPSWVFWMAVEVDEGSVVAGDPAGDPALSFDGPCSHSNKRDQWVFCNAMTLTSHSNFSD